MRVREGRFGVSFLLFSGVVVHLFLCPGVLDFFPIVILGQILNLQAPVIALAQDMILPGDGFVVHRSRQRYLQRSGTDAVLVVCVFPDLLYADFRRFGLVLVRHREAVDGAFILSNRVFGDGVLDLLAFRVLRQVLEGIRPSIFFAQVNFTNLLVIAQQGNMNLVRPHAVLILRVVPDLLHGDVDQFRRMRVGDLEPGRCVAGHFHRVSGGSVDFAHRVLDFLALFVLGQVLERMLPAVLVVQFHLRHGFAVRQQFHFHARRLDAILVLRVVPDLFDADFRRFRRMRVGDRCDPASLAVCVNRFCGCRVSRRYFDFLPGIVDRCAVCVDRQTHHHARPVVRSVQYNIRHRCAVQVLRFFPVRQQLHRDALRTQAVLVVLIIPHLQHRQAEPIRRVGVFDGRLRSFGLVARDAVIFDRVFHEGIHDLAALVLVLGQVGHFTLPAGLFVQRHLRIRRNVVLHQNHRHVLRTLPVAVVVVHPSLFDLGFRGLILVVEHRAVGIILNFSGQVAFVVVLDRHRHFFGMDIEGHGTVAAPELSDRILVFTRILFGVGNGSKRHFASRVIRLPFDQLAVLFAQFKGELIRFQRPSAQILGCFNLSRGAGGIGVHEVQRFRIVGGFHLQRAVAIVRQRHIYGVFRGIYRDTLAVFAGFLHVVGFGGFLGQAGIFVLIQIGQRVIQRGEYDLAIRVILYGLKHFPLAVIQRELEFIRLQRRRTAFQGLGALKGNAAGRFIGVHEVQRFSILGGFHLQRAVAIVSNSYGHFIRICSCRDAIAVLGRLGHSVGMFAGFIRFAIQRVVDGRIQDLAVGIIGDLGNQVFTFLDLKGEFTRLQSTPGQGLCSFKGDAARRFVTVGKRDCVHIDGFIQRRAIAVLHLLIGSNRIQLGSVVVVHVHLDRHFILALIIGVASGYGLRNGFLDGVGVGLADVIFGVLDRIEGDSLAHIGLGLIHAVARQGKGELCIRQRATRQGLFGCQNDFTFRMIDVGDGRIIGRFFSQLVFTRRSQSAILSFCNLHRQGDCFSAVCDAGRLVRGRFFSDRVGIVACLLVNLFSKHSGTAGFYRLGIELCSIIVLQHKGEFFILRSICAIQVLLHFGREGGFAVFVCKYDRILFRRADFCHQIVLRFLIVPLDGDRDFLSRLSFRIVGHAGDFGGYFLHGIDVISNLVEAFQDEFSIFTVGQLNALRCILRNARTFQDEGKQAVILLRVTGQGFLHRDFSVHAAVGQHSQIDQIADCIVLLDLLLFAFHPARMIAFSPGVDITVAVGIHLFHANCHRRPVVGFVQSELLLKRRVFNAVNRACQRHFQFRDVVARIHFTILNPLLGDSDAVTAGGILVDDLRSGLFVRSNLRMIFRLGQFLNERHVADGVAIKVNFFNCIRADRQVGDSLLFRQRDFKLLSRALGLTQDTLIIGHIPGGIADLGVYAHIELLILLCFVHSLHGILVAVILHLIIVDEHRLGDFQAALLQRVGHGNGAFVLLVDRGHAIFRTVGDHIASRYVNFDHLVSDLMSVIVLGQIIPGYSGRISVDGDGLFRFGNIAVSEIIGFIIHFIAAFQAYLYVFAQAIKAFFSRPSLGRAHADLFRFMCVGQFGNEGQFAIFICYFIDAVNGNGVLASTSIYGERDCLSVLVCVDAIRSVSGKHEFLPGVFVIVAVCRVEHLHAAHHGGPVVSGVQGNVVQIAINLFLLDPIAVQFRIQHGGPYAVAVVVVVPVLGHGNAETAVIVDVFELRLSGLADCDGRNGRGNRFSPHELHAANRLILRADFRHGILAAGQGAQGQRIFHRDLQGGFVLCQRRFLGFLIHGDIIELIADPSSHLNSVFLVLDFFRFSIHGFSVFADLHVLGDFQLALAVDDFTGEHEVSYRPVVAGSVVRILFPLKGHIGCCGCQFNFFAVVDFLHRIHNAVIIVAAFSGMVHLTVVVQAVNGQVFPNSDPGFRFAIIVPRSVQGDGLQLDRIRVALFPHSGLAISVQLQGDSRAFRSGNLSSVFIHPLLGDFDKRRFLRVDKLDVIRLHTNTAEVFSSVGPIGHSAVERILVFEFAVDDSAAFD